MLDETTPKGRIIAAALGCAAERRWRDVAMLDIAEKAGITLAELRREFPSKSAIVSAFARAVDEAVLARPLKREPGAPVRDTLFDVLMSRFDLLAPYKPALRSILDGAPPDLELCRRAMASQAWMLNAAGVPLNGLGGTAKVMGLASLYASVLQVWLDDDDPGQARTMAALDRRLRRAESMARSFDEMCATLGRVGDMFRPGPRSGPRPPEAAPEPVPPQL